MLTLKIKKSVLLPSLPICLECGPTLVTSEDDTSKAIGDEVTVLLLG